MALTKVSYSMINDTILNVLDFDADNTGSSDASPAIQAAVDALPATGGTIEFPIGTYKLESEILVSGKTGVILQGQSKFGCGINKSFSNNSAIRFLNANGWKIENISFQGNTEITGSGNLIYIEGSSHGNLSFCKVFNARGFGIKIEQGTGTNGAYYNVIENCWFFNNGVDLGTNGANIYCGAESSETKVIGGEYQSSPGAGWYIAGGNNHTGLGASFEGNTTYGIRAANAVEFAVFGCRFEGGGFMQYGIYLEGTLTTAGIYGCHMTSNVIGDVYPAAGSARISYFSNGNSTSPTAYQPIGINTWQQQLKIGGDFFVVSNNSGVAEIKGSSSTRLTTNSNGLELGSANGIIYLDDPVDKFNWIKFSDVTWGVGSLNPEGNVTASVGSLYTRTTGGAGTTLYIKESGTGNTGWVAK